MVFCSSLDGVIDTGDGSFNKWSNCGKLVVNCCWSGPKKSSCNKLRDCSNSTSTWGIVCISLSVDVLCGGGGDEGVNGCSFETDDVKELFTDGFSVVDVAAVGDCCFNGVVLFLLFWKKLNTWVNIIVCIEKMNRRKRGKKKKEKALKGYFSIKMQQGF